MIESQNELYTQSYQLVGRISNQPQVITLFGTLAEAKAALQEKMANAIYRFSHVRSGCKIETATADQVALSSGNQHEIWTIAAI